MALIVVTVTGTTVVVGDNDVVRIDIPGGGEVTIVAEPGGNVDKVNIKFVDDSQADTLNIDLSTFSEPDLQITIKNYDPSDKINLDGAFNQYVDPDDVDEFQFEYYGVGGDRLYWVCRSQRWWRKGLHGQSCTDHHLLCQGDRN